MNREDYLRELESAGEQMSSSARDLAEAANPVALLRAAVGRNWKWWLPGALAAGFLAAQLMRRPGPSAGRVDRPGSLSGGAAFWVPTLIKLLPTAAAQIVPLVLSLRSARKP